MRSLFKPLRFGSQGAIHFAGKNKKGNRNEPAKKAAMLNNMWADGRKNAFLLRLLQRSTFLLMQTIYYNAFSG
jgi:hypothetical protein